MTVYEARILVGGIFFGIALGLELAGSKALARLKRYRVELVREDPEAES